MKYLLALIVSSSLFQAAFAGSCYKCGVSYADPHIKTFQKSEFQCQGRGDFVLSKSLNSEFEMQSRFFLPEEGLHSGRNGSSTVAAVLNTGVGKEAKVEMRVVPEGFPASNAADCDIHYYVNGEKVEFNKFDVYDNKNRFYFARRTVEDHGWAYSFRQFQFYDSKAIFWASKGFDDVFGCHMNLQLCLPCDFDKDHDVVGLFGTLNGENYMDRDGHHIDESPSIGEQTSYCQDNWCVGSSWNSLFVEPNKYGRCTSDTTTNWDRIVENASQDIKNQCEGHVDCIIDTIVTGDIEIGLRTLEEAKEKGFKGDEEPPEPTESDKKEEDDTYTCTKAGVGSETAYARPSDGSGCFINDGFDRWGWRLEIDGTQSGSYTYDVWAGAGQCDIEAGELVAKVTVSYDVDTKTCEGKYEAINGYTLQEFQFYCGGDPFPRTQGGQGEETVAPGQYSCKQVETVSETMDICEVYGVTPKFGLISAMAHAVSCNQPEGYTAPETPAPTAAPETPAPTDAPETPAPTDAPETPAPTDAPETPAPTDAPTEAPETAHPTRSPTDAPEIEEPLKEPEQKMFAPPKEKGSGSGDPHFKTWNGEKYDYHGECDLVLIDHPTFNNGQGLRLHIRTTRVKYFSFIERAAIQIGDEILEFDNDAENFWLNGKPAEPNRKHHKTTIGGFNIRRDPKFLSIRLRDDHYDHSGYVAKIDFHTRKNGFPAVIVDGGNTDLFKGSLGLLGDWETGKKLARDGVTEIAVDDHLDAAPFALEWQVRDTEPLLFRESRYPQYPTVCTPPAKQNLQSRLGAERMRLAAEEACAHWKEDKEDCIFDVMATRDVLVAQEGHIVHVQ